MLKEIYDTIRGLIFVEMPKDSNGVPAIYGDEPIKGWYFGDRSIVSETPGIVIQGESSPPKDVAFGFREIEHKLTISGWVRDDDIEKAQTQSMELTRSIHDALLNHRRMWVLSRCPICYKRTLTPEHYLTEHTDVLGNYSDIPAADGSYVAMAKNNFKVLWEETHSTEMPELPKSCVAAEAFYLFYDDVAASQDDVFSGLTKQQIDVIQKSYIGTKVKPIRLIYDVIFTDVKPVKDGKEQQLMMGGEFSLSAKELIKISEFGPDNNIPVDSWD